MFRLGDFLIDRIQYAVFTDFNDDLIGVATQLSSASISITAEQQDITDAQGNLVKRVFRSKSGELTATNALLNTSFIALRSGTDIQYATESQTIDMPIIKTVKAGSTITLTEGYLESSVKVNALHAGGGIGEAFEKGTNASATEFAISAGGVLTPPTPSDATITEFIVMYHKDAQDGMKITNVADRFAKSCKMYLKCLFYDPCQPDELKIMIVEAPNFQPSADLSIDLSSESEVDMSGTFQIDYCSSDKVLYNIYILPDVED